MILRLPYLHSMAWFRRTWWKYALWLVTWDWAEFSRLIRDRQEAPLNKDSLRFAFWKIDKQETVFLISITVCLNFECINVVNISLPVCKTGSPLYPCMETTLDISRIDVPLSFLHIYWPRLWLSLYQSSLRWTPATLLVSISNMLLLKTRIQCFAWGPFLERAGNVSARKANSQTLRLQSCLFTYS